MSPAEVNQILDHIVIKLKDEYDPEKVILFGSYNRGTTDSGSDIDLLIIKNTQDRFIDRWATVRRILSDPGRTVAVDTLVLTPHEVSERLARGDQFLAEILHQGRILYAA
jgi:predicted nucleotidyltransferase